MVWSGNGGVMTEYALRLHVEGSDRTVEVAFDSAIGRALYVIGLSVYPSVQIDAQWERVAADPEAMELERGSNGEI